MRAVIVGGSRGIGAATAKRLEWEGWDVTDVSRTTSHVDVSDRNYMMRYLWNTRTPDLLVYSAGHVQPGHFLDISEKSWAYHLEVNLTAAFRCLHWFAARWAAVSHPGESPAVVLIASTAALRPSPEWAAYAAAKAGLVNLALSAAVELAPKGIRVYCVAPGRCATHLRATLAPDEDPNLIMQPEEVAEVVSKLAADEAGVLAGQVIQVARR